MENKEELIDKQENNEESIKMHISKLIKEYRQKNNLKQEDLAAKLNYSQKSIAKWEQSLALPPLEVVFKLKEMMNISLDEFYGFKKRGIIDSIVDKKCEHFYRFNFDIDKLSDDEKKSFLDKIKENSKQERTKYIEELFCNFIKPAVIEWTTKRIDPYDCCENPEIVNWLKMNLFSSYYFIKVIGGHIYIYGDKYFLSPAILKEMLIICKKVFEDRIENSEKFNLSEDRVKEIKEYLENIIIYSNITRYLIFE